MIKIQLLHFYDRTSFFAHEILSSAVRWLSQEMKACNDGVSCFEGRAGTLDASLGHM